MQHTDQSFEIDKDQLPEGMAVRGYWEQDGDMVNMWLDADYEAQGLTIHVRRHEYSLAKPEASERAVELIARLAVSSIQERLKKVVSSMNLV